MPRLPLGRRRSALLFCFMVAAVGNAPAIESEAIDPTARQGKPDDDDLDGHVLDNTLQQFVLFLVGHARRCR